MGKTGKKPVVVTTEYRGVFFGYVKDDSEAPEKIELENTRMCVYWSADMKGIFGLASHGPSKDCRVTHAIPLFTAWKVTSVLDCTPEAAEKWEAAVWK